MQEIKQLLEITQKLRNEYKGGFTLDEEYDSFNSNIDIEDDELM